MFPICSNKPRQENFTYLVGRIRRCKPTHQLLEGRDCVLLPIQKHLPPPYLVGKELVASEYPDYLDECGYPRFRREGSLFVTSQKDNVLFFDKPLGETCALRGGDYLFIPAKEFGKNTRISNYTRNKEFCGYIYQCKGVWHWSAFLTDALQKYKPTFAINRPALASKIEGIDPKIKDFLDQTKKFYTERNRAWKEENE